ncbi:MAG TPA: EF-hand domain-containing protein [Bacteroidota bacterium]|nr:EF-hand domain-containing protein [Bacteroidota bacterium]
MVGSVSGNTNRLAIDLGSVSSSQRHAEVFKKLDTNGDGKIDATELAAVTEAKGKGKDAAAIMKEVDTNGDGAIDSSENDAFLTTMEAHRGGKMPPPGPPPSGGPKGGKPGAASTNHNQIFDKLDTNKDGKVSLEELLAATTDDSTSSDVQDLFKSMDSDSDGSISQSELDTFLTKLEKELETLMHTSRKYSADGKDTTSGLGQSIDSVA